MYKRYSLMTITKVLDAFKEGKTTRKSLARTSSKTVEHKDNSVTKGF
jgi:hypothetical protein